MPKLSISLDIVTSPVALLYGSTAAYVAGGYFPGLVADFESEYYRTEAGSQDFSDLVTHSRAGNATMVDSDGTLKWAPHNLLTYSEDFTQAAWLKSNLSVSGSKIVATANNGSIRQAAGFPVAANVAAIFNLNTGLLESNLSGSFDEVSSEALSGGGYRFLVKEGSYTAEVDAWPGEWSFISIQFFSGSLYLYPAELSTGTGTADGTSGINIGRVHAYRSDLGGMVNNPDRGDSYVPTTSAAVYLPRRGHHVYNGSSWVNEGLLVESEARTNLLLQSEQFDTTWSSDNLSGLTDDGDYWTLTTDGTNTQHGVSQTASLSGDTFCAWAVVSYDNAPWFRLQLGSAGSNDQVQQLYDLQNGVKGTTTSFGSNLSSYDTGIEEIGDGVYLLWVYGVYTSTRSSLPVFLRIHNADTAATHAVSGLSVKLYRTQLEAGSTPSSYIPTSGSTVTRAAETLTVPAAKLPWPTPKVIGDELVTNGTFDTDISGWTDSTTGASTFTWSSGTAELFKATGESAAFYQGLSLTEGGVYRLTWSDSGTGGTVRVGTSAGGQDVVSITSAKEIVFTAANSNFLQFNCGTNGATAVLDNISVREIDPLAVSIQMEGRMTYADEGAFDTAVYWTRGAFPSFPSDFMYTTLNTSGGGSGGPQFAQKAGGVNDFVLAVDAYSPGILVPFNIASRHGSTFVNGAVDGTALTADTTPVALPDLESTDLSLAYDYMGTVKLFRVWADDLGDAGIEEASA